MEVRPQVTRSAGESEGGVGRLTSHSVPGTPAESGEGEDKRSAEKGKEDWKFCKGKHNGHHFYFLGILFWNVQSIATTS